MTQRNARIRDALKTEYADFVDFCVTLDKQFVSELTTSDFIAFRTQHGATRDYVASIRQALESYDPDIESQEEENQIDFPVGEVSVTESTEEIISLPDMAGIKEIELEASQGEPEFDDFISLTEDIQSEEKSDSVIRDADDQFASISKRQKVLSSQKPYSYDDSIEKQESKNSDVHYKTTRVPRSLFVKQWFDHLDELRSMDLELPLYDLFGIPRNILFSIKMVDELELSVRPYNCLLNNHCKTLDALFKKNLREIGEFANLGKKSLLEIISKCKKIAENFQTTIEGTKAVTAMPLHPAVKANEKLIAVAESIALGIKYDITNLSEDEKEIVYRLEDAYQILGEDMCLLALEKSDKARNICAMLNDGAERLEVHKQINLLVNHLSEHGISINLHIMPFIAAIKKQRGNTLSTIFTENDRFSDMTTAIESYLESRPENKAIVLDSLQVFIKEICIGITKNLGDAYKKVKTTDRVPVVIHLRQEGCTLAEIGDTLSLTRERVRQIESKAIRTFSTSLKHVEKDIIAFIHAMLDGDLMIHKEEIAAFVPDSDQMNLLWACIENGSFDTKAYNYEKRYKAIVFKNDNTRTAANIVGALPSYIFKDDLETIVRHAVDKEGIWEETIRADIRQRYKVFGTFYSERRPTVVFICDWILKNCFTDGYKISDEIDAKRFLEYIREVFGEESCHMTQRALDAKVSQVGLLCDRGKYIHPSMVIIDESILDEVNQYIIDSPKNAITYIELFEAFRDKLAGTQISNHYYLQGVLKQYGSNVERRLPYYFYRDYITKDENVSPTDELDAFVRERGIVHKSEMFAEFPALNEVTIGQVVARCPNILSIDRGNYIHVSQFHILDADYVWLRAYLTEVTRELPINIRKAFDDCSVQFPKFMDRNEIHSYDFLFSVLNYMFRNEFKFNRPYIANSNDVELTNRGVILSILEPYDEIAIDELMDLLDERSIHYISLTYLMELIAPDYIRTDENTFMKRSITGIDDDVEDEALNILSSAIEINGYLPSCKVIDFIWYPSIDVTWTPYLLESLVLSSDRIDYVPYTFNRSHRTLVVYVNKKYANCDFQTLLLKIISEEYDKGTFTRKSDMRDWLIEAGLIDVKLPNFLESAQYYYMSDDGRLVRREEAEL